MRTCCSIFKENTLEMQFLTNMNNKEDVDTGFCSTEPMPQERFVALGEQLGELMNYLLILKGERWVRKYYDSRLLVTGCFRNTQRHYCR